jgi:hypothetical protein
MKALLTFLVVLGLFGLSCGRHTNSTFPGHSLSSINASSSPDNKLPGSANFSGGIVAGPDAVNVAASTGASPDPVDIADEEEIVLAQMKGNWLHCLMDNTDMQVGLLFNPYGQTPPTARSPWTGTLGKRPNPDD